MLRAWCNALNAPFLQRNLPPTPFDPLRPELEPVLTPNVVLLFNCCNITATLLRLVTKDLPCASVLLTVHRVLSLVDIHPVMVPIGP